MKNKPKLPASIKMSIRVGWKKCQLVGKKSRVTYHGHEFDIVPLPHPSGASPWHRIEPGRTLLAQALDLIIRHPAWPRKA